eukprot:FR736871.1.p1 GENE.FR736871.1~~FR736871.1.p1  ORF type:complete len:289 (+),score=43.11 FR736871.1:24-869(+)
MMRQKLQDKQKRIDELMGSEDTPGLIDESKNERDAIFADSRNEYLRNEYGAEVTKQLRDDASTAYDALVKERSTLGNEVKSLNLALSNATPSPTEFEEECERVDEDELQVPDSVADAEYLCEVVLEIDEGTESQAISGQVEKWYCLFEDSSKRGRMIPGPFDPNPEIKKIQRAVMKKLTDKEEADLRKKEIEAVKARQEGMKQKQIKENKGADETMQGKGGFASKNVKANVMGGQRRRPSSASRLRLRLWHQSQKHWPLCLEAIAKASVRAPATEILVTTI